MVLLLNVSVFGTTKPQNTAIKNSKLYDYSRTIFDHGYTPITPGTLFNSFIDMNNTEESYEAVRMSRVLIRKSFIMFVCGNYITDEMKLEMLYARQIGITVVPLDGITKVSEYLEKGE